MQCRALTARIFAALFRASAPKFMGVLDSFKNPARGAPQALLSEVRKKLTNLVPRKGPSEVILCLATQAS
jgi:hypothetical protein